MSIYKELSFENDIETIKAIQFAVMSPETIERKSVCEIVSTDTYSVNEPIIGGLFDSRMGVIENDKICKTCNQKNTFCPGHFGHIKLAKPVFYIQFFDIVRKILKCVCFRCSRILIDPENPTVQKMMNKKFSRQKRFDFLYKCCSKIKRCGQENKDGCGAKLPHKTIKENIGKIVMEWKDEDTVKKIVYNAEDILIILKRITDDDSTILGFPPSINRPENLICTVFPVPPPSVRPSVRNDTGQRCEDDLTHKLCDIIKTNNTLKQKLDRDNVNVEQIDYWYILLQFHIATFVDNQIPGIPPAKQRTGRPLRSLTERLKSKEGRIRGNLMGKRVDFSARSVITPDPNIDIDELGVPLKIAMNLTFPEIVNAHNIDELYKLVYNGNDTYPGAKYIRKNDGTGYRTIRLKNLKKEQIVLNYGDIVDRHLRNGDYVLFNRQPSLHKMSMMAHKVRVMSYDTFRLNVCCTPSYNADYDGDEMNMHVPQSIQTEYELMSLASVPTQIISPRESSPIISVVQDIVVGLYRITKDNVFVNNKQFFNILAGNSKFTGDFMHHSHQIKGAKVWEGRELLSSVLNPLINLESGKTGIKNGVIKKGQVAKKRYQGMTYGLIHYVYNELGVDECKALFDNTQRLICDWLIYNGFSVGISDLIINEPTQDKLKEVVKELKVDVYEVIRKLHMNTFENTSIMNNLEHFENLINQRLDKATKDINNIGMNNINDLDNRMMNMINSKSKGNPINVSQMMGSVGQQSVEGKRIMYGFDHRTLPHFTKYDDGPESRGFVENSFIKGLTAQEFFFHAMGGREGLIDTAVKSVTGETEIIVMENGKSLTTTIGTWIDDHLAKRSSEIQHFPEDRNMEFLELPAGTVYIPTGDDKGVTSWGELTAVTRHDPGFRVFRVTTQSGRTVTVADSESLLIWNPETEEFKKMESELVQLGDCVPVAETLGAPPTIIDHVDMADYFPKTEYIYGTDFNKAVAMMNEAQGDKYFIPRGWWAEHNGSSFTLPYTKKASLTRMTSGRSHAENIKDGFIYPYGARRDVSAIPEKFVLDRDNGRFVGLFLADGNACDRTGKVCISKNDERVLNFAEAWFNKHDMKHKTYSRLIENDKLKGTTTTIQGYSSLMARFFDALVGKGSAYKRIPEVAFMAPDEFVLGLIEGYITGDGTVDINGKYVSIGSTSVKMAEGFALLMSRYGIFSRIRKTQLKSNNLGTENIKPMYTLTVVGMWAARLADKVELFIDHKQERLAKMKDLQGSGKFETTKNMVIDPIVNIEILGVEDYPKLYDVTVPSTLKFITMNGVNTEDTSETGYLQRKLIKAMEDAKVSFDMTVRNANGHIIQFMYGEDSIDPIKLEKHHLDYLKFDVSLAKMEENYLITEQDNLKYVVSDRVMKEMYDTPDWVERMRGYFERVLADREFVISKVIKNTSDDVVFHPIGVGRMLEKIEHMFNLRNSKFPSELSPLYVLEQMDRVQAELRISASHPEVRLLGVIIRHYFSPKKLIVQRRFSREAFEYFVEHFKQRYLEALIHPSDMVGVVAAQSIGEPSTQLTLNSVEYNTEIMVSENGKLKEYRIGDWIESRIANGDQSTHQYIEKGDQIYAPISEDEDVRILSADENGRVFWDHVDAVTRHLPINEDGSNTLIRVTTLSGHQCTVTKGESVLTRQNNKLLKSKGSDLKIGDYLPAMRTLPMLEENRMSELDLSEYVSKSEFVYMSEVEKALAVNKEYTARGDRHWWKANKGTRFELPYTRSDGFVDAFVGIGGKPGRRTQLDNRPNCVYPKTTIHQPCHIPERLPLDELFGFVIGAYLAEGCLTQYHVLISNNDDAFIRRIAQWADQYGINYHFDQGEKPKGYSRTIRMHSLVLAELFGKLFQREVIDDEPVCVSEVDEAVVDEVLEDMVYDMHHESKQSKRTVKSSSRSKHLPVFLLGAPDECLKGLIDGYFSGDGCVADPKKKTNIAADSVSKQLLDNVSLVLRKFGVHASIRASVGAYNNAIRRGFQTTMPYHMTLNKRNSVEFAKTFTLTAANKQERLNQIRERSYTKDSMTDIVPNVVLSNGQCIDEMALHTIDLKKYENTKDYDIIKAVLDANVFYDRVVKIEEVQSRHSHVFDMTTRISRNFTDKFVVQIDTFHLSGVASASKAVRGVPRIKELLSVSKNIKAPSCTIYLNDKVKNYNDAKVARYSIETTYLKSLATRSEIYYEPNKHMSTIEGDQELIDAYNRFADIDDDCYTLVSPWLLRLELNRQAMLEVGLTTLDINLALKKYYNETISCMFSDDNHHKVVFRSSLTDPDIADIITDLKALEYNIMEKIIISGVEKIKKVSIAQKKRKVLDEDEEFKKLVDREEYTLETDGSNLTRVLANAYVDSQRTISNDITEIFEVFGIEAARQALYNEIDDILNSTTSVNHRHIALLVDTMTCKGYLLSVDRHGINRSDIGPLAKCSFEETSDILIKAGVFGEVDKVSGVSANIILGQIANCGTGDVKVNMDISNFDRMRPIQELKRDPDAMRGEAEDSDEEGMFEREEYGACDIGFEYDDTDEMDEVIEEKAVNKLIVK